MQPGIPEIVFPCLKEMPAITKMEMAEATPIVVERNVINVVNEVLDKISADAESCGDAGLQKDFCLTDPIKLETLA